MPRTIAFVHGWSVKSTDTYGQLPERLIREASERGERLDARHVWLSRYVSFRDEVRVEDLARAFQAAIERDLADVLKRRERFACITHSTGGPVVRAWWSRYHLEPRDAPPCPLSHLVMLAPANFGSALAQLGKHRLSRIKAWFQGVEPGTGVLEWLELGSPECWDLSRRWIALPKNIIEEAGVFPFVLTGQTIDRKLYDHVNPYTGEKGTDGVVRVAAANLNATYIRLEQEKVRIVNGRPVAPELVARPAHLAPATAFKVLPGCAHSGSGKGILRSVRDDGKPHPTVAAVVDCLRVSSFAAYEALRTRFDRENVAVQDRERVEVHDRILLPGTITVTDRYAMVVFRIEDETGRCIGDFDLKLTATSWVKPDGEASPDLLPRGFFGDRQRNSRRSGTLTYYVNADVMTGAPAVRNPEKPEEWIRPELRGAPKLGFQIEPHVSSGFVHFLPAELVATPAVLQRFVRPNETTLVDIVMRRAIREGVFQLGRLSERSERSFAGTPEGPPITD